MFVILLMRNLKNMSNEEKQKRSTCQICKRPIMLSKFWDKIHKGWECNKCYLSKNSKIK